MKDINGRAEYERKSRSGRAYDVGVGMTILAIQDRLLKSLVRICDSIVPCMEMVRHIASIQENEARLLQWHKRLDQRELNRETDTKVLPSTADLVKTANYK